MAFLHTFSCNPSFDHWNSASLPPNFRWSLAVGLRSADSRSLSRCRRCHFELWMGREPTSVSEDLICYRSVASETEAMCDRKRRKMSWLQWQAMGYRVRESFRKVCWKNLKFLQSVSWKELRKLVKFQKVRGDIHPVRSLKDPWDFHFFFWWRALDGRMNQTPDVWKPTLRFEDRGGEGVLFCFEGLNRNRYSMSWF